MKYISSCHWNALGGEMEVGSSKHPPKISKEIIKFLLYLQILVPTTNYPDYTHMYILKLTCSIHILSTLCPQSMKLLSLKVF